MQPAKVNQLLLFDHSVMNNKSPLTSAAHPIGFIDRPWMGINYESKRILVLGESWYGDWGSEHNSDHGYVTAYLTNKISDRMYTKMANACGLARDTYWHSIAFTNFVIWAGHSRTDRPTSDMYKSAIERLDRLLQEHKPQGVWILGKEQSQYSEPVIRNAGVKCEVALHPTSYGVSNQVLGESWKRLIEQLPLSPRG